MKVLNLQCSNGHAFEGWFASEVEWQRQVDADLIDCPLCSDRHVSRLPSAPRLNLGGSREAQSPATEAATPERHLVESLWMKAVQHVLRNTEDVGERFTEEARRIHYGEVSQRGIRGKATREQAEALTQEGIEVQSLPIPVALKGTVQ